MFNPDRHQNARAGPSVSRPSTHHIPLLPRLSSSSSSSKPNFTSQDELKRDLELLSGSPVEEEDLYMGEGDADGDAEVDGEDGTELEPEGYTDPEGEADEDGIDPLSRDSNHRPSAGGTTHSSAARPTGGGAGNNNNNAAEGGNGQKKRRIGGGPGSRGGGANEGKGGSGIVRVNRACTNCRRMKMRCVGAESPPCKRCSHTGQTCVMQKPGKPGPTASAGSVSGQGHRHARVHEHEHGHGHGTGSGAVVEVDTVGGSSVGLRLKEEERWDAGGVGEDGYNRRSEEGDDRIRFLESQMSSMQNTLLDLVSTIKASSALNPRSTGSSAYEHISPASVGSLTGFVPVLGGTVGGGMMQTQGVSPPTVGTLTMQSGATIGTGNDGLGQMGSSNINPATMLARGRMSSGTIPSMAHPMQPIEVSHQGLMGINLHHTPPAVSSYLTSPSLPPFNPNYSASASAAAGNEFMEQALNLGPSPAPSGSTVGPGRAHSVGVQITYSQQSSGENWPFANTGRGPPPSRGASVDVNAMSHSGHLGSAPAYVGSSAAPIPSSISAKQSHLRGPPAASGDNSPAMSETEDEDPLGPTSLMAPLSSMAGLAEAAASMGRMEPNLKGKQPTRSGADPGGAGGGKAPDVRPVEDDPDRPSKKRRLTDSGKVAFATPAVPEYALHGPRRDKVQIGNSPIVDLPVVTEFVRTARGKEARRHIHAFPDVIALGLVAEDEARELFRLFFEGCHAFIPIFDLDRDTWDSLRDRSPFLITSIVAIGARVRDGGGSISDTQRVSLDHARKIAISTLFSPVHRVEAIQAMILISAFNDTGWVPANYTGLLAIDMGLNKCFVKLLQSGMGAGKVGPEVEDDRDLVVGSRSWLCLYMIEHQMAFGTGRPALLREDECISRCRMLLQHPLSIPSDVRLISTVELMALRAPLHVLLTNSPDQPVDQATVNRLQQANADFDRWQAHWDRVLSERFSIDRSDFYRESLAVQREYSSLFINSQLLRGVREAADVKRMPEDKRELALRAMRNAQACLEIALRGRSYRKALKFAVHYTHVCAAFAASFLVRIARLFPKELDLRKTAKDVEELAAVLAEIPAGRYSRSLRLILRRARKQKVMPPPTAPSSPNRLLASLLPQVQSQPSGHDRDSGPSSSSMLSTSVQPQPNASGAGAYSHVSPGSLLAQMGKNPPQDSPNSNPEGWQQYDFDFAQDLWNRAGVREGGDEQLPLYLNGESLGNMDTLNPAFNLENFFVPPDVDLRLGDLGAFPEPFSGMSWPVPSPQQDVPPDMWW